MRRVAVIIGSRQEVGTSALASPPYQRLTGRPLGWPCSVLAAWFMPIAGVMIQRAWRYALAAGATEVRHLEAVAGLDYDVMLVGSGGAEPYGDLLLAQLAAEKQCAVVFEVLDVMWYRCADCDT